MAEDFFHTFNREVKQLVPGLQDYSLGSGWGGDEYVQLTGTPGGCAFVLSVKASIPFEILDQIPCTWARYENDPDPTPVMVALCDSSCREIKRRVHTGHFVNMDEFRKKAMSQVAPPIPLPECTGKFAAFASALTRYAKAHRNVVLSEGTCWKYGTPELAAELLACKAQHRDAENTVLTMYNDVLGQLQQQKEQMQMTAYTYEIQDVCRSGRPVSTALEALTVLAKDGQEAYKKVNDWCKQNQYVHMETPIGYGSKPHLLHAGKLII